MDELAREEYAALRATIRERGTVRPITFLATMIAWAVTEILVLASGPRDVLEVLLPLMILAAGFEVIFQLHVGVERVGRYLQVVYEQKGEPARQASAARWETTAMAYGRAYRSAGSGALFIGVFVLATLLNLLPMLMTPMVPVREMMPLRVSIVLVAHIAFVARMRFARKRSASQRAEDLHRFEQLLG